MTIFAIICFSTNILSVAYIFYLQRKMNIAIMRQAVAENHYNAKLATTLRIAEQRNYNQIIEILKEI